MMFTTKDHFVIGTLVICILFGLACALPSFLVLLDPNMQMFTINKKSAALFDEGTYYAKASSFVMTQHRLPFELEIYELKNAVTFNAPLPAMIIGSLARLLNNNLPVAWTFTKFLFPSISLFLSIYLASMFVEKNVYAWLTGLLFCTFGQGPQTFLMLTDYARSQPLIITRIEPQAIGLPIFLLFVLSACKLCNGQGSIWRWINGVSGGLLFYIYFFFYSLVPFVYAGMLLLFLIIHDMERIKDFFMSMLFAFALAIPYIFQLSLLTPSGYVSKGIIPAGYHHKLWILLPSLIMFTLFLILSIYFRWFTILRDKLLGSWKKLFETEQLKNLFSAVPILSVIFIALMLVYVVSPYIFPLPETGHYIQRVIVGFTFFLLLTGVIKLLTLKPSTNFHIATVSLVCLLVVYIFVKQWIFWQVNRGERRVVEQERSTEELIRSHTLKDAVIAVRDPYYNVIFPSRAHRYRFYADMSRSVVDRNENLQRFVFISKLFGRTWNDVTSELTPPINTQKHNVTGYPAVTYLAGVKSLNYDQLESLHHFYQNADVSFLQNRRLDYIVVNNSQIDKFVSASELIGIHFKKAVTLGEISLFRRI